jgi:hypothetical protein
MLLMHYIEDFHLQGCLANLKQKKWWEKEVAENLFHCKYDENRPRRKALLRYSRYKNDYKMSLFVHSIENALFVMLPLIVDTLISEYTHHVQNIWILFVPSVVLICVSHYLIDDSKANKMKINLVQNQLLHLGFIVFIFICHFPIIGAWSV